MGVIMAPIIFLNPPPLIKRGKTIFISLNKYPTKHNTGSCEIIGTQWLVQRNLTLVFQLL